jgi:hypothetical protein
MNFCMQAASVFLGGALVSWGMAEYGLSSIWGDFRPTHQTAMTCGIISVAFSSLGTLMGRVRPK